MKRLLLLPALFCILGPADAAERRPNLIVFYTDDHGFADLGVRGVMKDLRTPHLDALARSGVVATHGYSTAPQCVPSRGGLMTGRFQGRFNLDNNGSSLNGFNRQVTLAERLQEAGYVTAQFGKWHLGPMEEIPRHGFRHVFAQHGQQVFAANITVDGRDRPMGDHPPSDYHIDACSKAAEAVIGRYHDQPFFLYVAYRAPHTPLDAPQHYKDRFPGPMPERRRAALGMLAAVDDGVGRITSALEKHGLTQQTLVFFIGDNGAPLKIHKQDSPLNGDAGGWDGSLNDPLNGEKGMLSEGGMHVPFLIAWPGVIPGGRNYDHPVSALDVTATAAALADIKTGSGELDGVNLLPFLKEDKAGPPHEALYWRWMAQSAVREGRWKLLRGGEREYLYDLDQDLGEEHNLAAKHPEIAARLREKLQQWSAALEPPGMALGPMAAVWNDYFDFYLEGKPVAAKPSGGGAAGIQGWQARGGTAAIHDGALVIRPADSAAKKTRPFLTNADISLPGPVTVTLKVRAREPGKGSLSWRTKDEKDFVAAHSAAFEWKAGPEIQELKVELPVQGRLIHLRLLPTPTTALEFSSIEIQPRTGKARTWSFAP